jgi:hypothetical protein
VKNTGLSRFFQKYLLQRAISVFKWTFPETWSKDYFLYVLYCWGYISVINTNKFGVIPQGCGLRGYDVFYRPTTAVITNPLLSGMKELRIDKQCTIIKLQPDYSGIMDIVGYYGDMMALCAESAGVNLVNSKLSYVFTATDKASAESFKKLYDRVASGEPCVVQDKHLKDEAGNNNWEAFAQNVGQNYIAGDILNDLRTLENMFDTEIGIPNSNTTKRERLITDEVNSNNVETFTKCDMWLENIKESLEKTNKMFGTNITAEWRVNPQETEDDDNAVDDESTRSV